MIYKFILPSITLKANEDVAKEITRITLPNTNTKIKHKVIPTLKLYFIYSVPTMVKILVKTESTLEQRRENRQKLIWSRALDQ